MKSIRTCVCLGFFILLSSLAKPVFGQLKAQFTSNLQSGCSPLIIAFQDQSQGNPLSWKWNLGNGATSTNQNPVTTYSDPGTYYVTLTVTDASGKTATSAKYSITVYSNPVAAFSAKPTLGCYPLNVIYANSSTPGSGTLTDYLWDFGDGNISTDASPSHIYTSPGTFDVTLKLTNSYGCTNALTKSDLVHIDNGVNAGFTINSIDVCKSPVAATFNNTTNGSGTLTYLWNYGDGTTGASPTHNYAKSGTYNVVLTAQSSAGCSDTASLNVTVAIPTTSFTNSDATCSNQKINFTNTSVPTPVSNTWYFSDGSISTQLNPSKTFTKTGIYTVKLVNEFSENCKDSIIKTITVASGPSVSFSTLDTAKCSAPYPVNFKNETTGTGLQYNWDFGDKQQSTEANPKHIYETAGLYTVTLTATNANGCQNTFQVDSYIKIQPVKITKLLNLPDSGCAPLTVKPTAVFNITTKVKSYNWNFGDGGTSTDEAPMHTYTKEGFFTVTLTIETVDGCTTTYALKNAAIVGHKPHANFYSDFDTICVNGNLDFHNSSTNGPITFLRWDFGAFLDSAHGQVHHYQPYDTGYFQVTLIAYNYGCADTMVKKHALYALPPYARFKYQLNCDNKNLVSFKDTSIVDAIYSWDFGDGTTSTQKNPVHNYTTPGIYNVSLYTTNKACHDTATNSVHVINEKGDMFLEKSIYCRGNTMTGDINGINESNISSTTWDFGDQTIKTVNGGTAQNHVYVTTGKYLITAKMIDLNNCSYDYKAKDSITVFGPLSRFTSAKPGACQGGTINFDDKSETDGLHKIVKWSWDYGTGTNYDYVSPAVFLHTYPDTGYYNVRLTVTDSYGCSDSEKRVNYVYVSHPYASFKMNDSVQCPGGTILFRNTSTGTGLIYNWDFDNGKTSAQKNYNYTYTQPGTFHPSLSIIDVNGCTAEAKSEVIVSTPKAIFNMSDSFSTCPPLEVRFQNKSTYYSSLSWDFGDGSTSLLDTPTHLYNFAGAYYAKVVVKGHGNCQDSITKRIIIKGPSGKIKYDATPICAPGNVQFSAEAKNTVGYIWDYSDGNTIATSINQSSHKYDEGFYLPKLILTDASGCKVAIKGTDTIRVYGVKANALLSNAFGCDTAIVQFKDASISNDKITHHYWFFGDNDSTDAIHTDHTYSAIGKYNAKLITVTQTGCRDTLNIAAPVVIAPAPKIKISGDSAACATAKLNFVANNSAADTSAIIWSWNFSNGASGAGQTASTSYASGGTYLISLKGITSNGCTDSTSFNVKISNAPVVKATPDSSVCQNSNFKLSATGAVKYQWQGVGLSCTDCQFPTAVASNAANYKVIGTDEIGCTGSDSTFIKIITPTKMSVSTNDTICVGESLKLSAVGEEHYQWYPSIYLDNDKSAEPTFKPAKDTTIQYKVVGYGAQNCFADTGFVFVKAFAVPHINIQNKQSDELVIGSGQSVRLISNSSADVTQWRWSPSAGLDNPGSANPVAAPRQTTTYSVIASNGGGCVSRDEITVRVVCKNTNVFVPNTFSPNNDGMNDVFYPRGTGLFNIKSFRIFNRWGQVMFEKFNVTPNNAGDGWNGTYNGKALEPDVYVYMMEITCENGFSIPIKGNITLLK